MKEKPSQRSLGVGKRQRLRNSPGSLSKYRSTLADLFFDYQFEPDGVDRLRSNVITAWAEKLQQSMKDEVCQMIV
jgi:hypothetical protein